MTKVVVVISNGLNVLDNRGYSAQYIHDECYGVRQDYDGGFVMTGGSGNETPSYSNQAIHSSLMNGNRT